MIKSIRINNFRCFSRIDVDGLSRVNVIVGANGSGKTALLESLFLASGGSPELAMRLRLFRGMGTNVELRTEGLDAIWKNLFHNFDQRKSIDIVLRATDMQDRSLTISKGSAQEVRLPLKAPAGSPQRRSGRTVTAPIEFSWKDATGRTFTSRPVVSGDKLTFPQEPLTTNIVFIPSQFRLNPEETAQRFSAVSRKNAVTDLMSVLSGVYEDIEDISVENSDGSWEVFAKVKGLAERIPMALHSSGASRFIGIMLAVTAAEGGVVLVDELENGFYYKTLPAIWKALLAIATEFKCQIFASTHSNECLQALSEAIGDEQDSFALLNVERTDTGSRVVVSSGDVFSSALSSGFDIR